MTRTLPLLPLLLLPSLATAAPLACGSVPTQMRAAIAPRAGGPEVLELRTVATPAPGPDEVLVRVHYASVNPVDWKLQERGALPYPAIPGGDFSGEVVAAGDRVQAYACGARVAGIADARGRGGSYAEYVVVPSEAIVLKPEAYSMAEAAAYPTVAIAAWRYLIASADLQPGERVLVHGGAGGVGSMLVQMAKARGAIVIATASARNHDYLRGLGADQVIDYTTTRFEDAVRGVDVVVDTVGGDTLARSPAVLRDGGRLVTLVGSVPPALCDARIRCPAAPGWNVPAGLAHAAPLIASGQLKVNIERSYPLDQAAAAQQHNREGRTRGKVVIAMGADETAAALVPLQAYLDGHATGEGRHFQRAFAADGWLIGLKDGAYRQWPARDYIAASSSGQAPRDEAQRRRSIRQLTVTGQVATAVIELDYPDMKALDHMSLLKRDGEWRIVAKVYDAMTPAPAAAAGD
ncbi:nuclear transport factor 2 family protein [Arenimonas terrae]|uniref:nuclear transport factor 2 family protein n=1 Tax=Arenimonas terrae TaxID=2546226 RepID=UPI00159EBBF0|nr:nuclear transport factor 2 family protein [Arenimonas terrae]